METSRLSFDERKRIITISNDFNIDKVFPIMIEKQNKRKYL